MGMKKLSVVYGSIRLACYGSSDFSAFEKCLLAFSDDPDIGYLKSSLQMLKNHDWKPAIIFCCARESDAAKPVTCRILHGRIKEREKSILVRLSAMPYRQAEGLQMEFFFIPPMKGSCKKPLGSGAPQAIVVRRSWKFLFSPNAWRHSRYWRKMGTLRLCCLGCWRIWERPIFFKF